jgi:hypothetical protein
MNAATRLVLEAHRQLFTGGQGDPAAIEPALDGAQAATGVAVPPHLRPALADLMLRATQTPADLGGYAGDWTLQEVGPSEARITPAGAAGGAMPGGTTITGRVRSPIGPDGYLVVDAPGQQQQLNLRAAGVTVTRDGQPARLADLQAGDTVTMLIGSDDVVQRVDASSAAGGAAPDAALARVITGTVNDNNEGQLTVTTAGGRQQYMLPPGAYVAREGQTAELGAVQAQDSVALVVAPSGEVQAVFARLGGGDYVVEGTVAGPLEGQILPVRFADQTIAVAVPAIGVAVSRNNSGASLEDLRPDDQVSVRFDANGQPTVIEAMGGAGPSRWLRSPWLLLCLIPLLLLALLFLLRRDLVERTVTNMRGSRRRTWQPSSELREEDDPLG